MKADWRFARCIPARLQVSPRRSRVRIQFFLLHANAALQSCPPSVPSQDARLAWACRCMNRNLLVPTDAAILEQPAGTVLAQGTAHTVQCHRRPSTFSRLWPAVPQAQTWDLVSLRRRRRADMHAPLRQH